MRSWKRVLPFLLLNILISAATTLTVLILWDRSHRSALPAAGSLNPAQMQPAENNATGGFPPAQDTLPPLEEPVILIETIIGTGDLANEVVVLRRVGEGELQLTGWKLSNGRGSEYAFPELLLNKNGTVRLYSRVGTNSVLELFWGADQSVWRSGDTVTLTDWQGNARASYSIP
ncbi:MAG: lamin tail domain-containing protein [Chloroflexota bacterium]|jgi:hypothetical protein